jgi:chaperonin GroEL
MQFDKGYISPYFVTNAESMEADPRESLHAHLREEDQQPEGSAPVLEKVAKTGKPLSSSLKTSKAKPSRPSW